MSKKVKLFTVQSIKSWQIAQEKGVVRHDSWEHIMEESFKEPYAWMVQQMVQRIGAPYADSAIPIWAWYECEGRNYQSKKQLERGGHLSEGEEGVYLEFESDMEKCLSSEFIAWHQVLNRGYLPLSDEEFDAFEAWLEEEGLNYCIEFEEYSHVMWRVQKSWENVFKLKESKAYHKSESVQVCLWEIPLASVSKVVYFKAKRPGTFVERRREDLDKLMEFFRK